MPITSPCLILSTSAPSFLWWNFKMICLLDSYPNKFNWTRIKHDVFKPITCIHMSYLPTTSYNIWNNERSVLQSEHRPSWGCALVPCACMVYIVEIHTCPCIVSTAEYQYYSPKNLCIQIAEWLRHRLKWSLKTGGHLYRYTSAELYIFCYTNILQNVKPTWKSV